MQCEMLPGPMSGHKHFLPLLSDLLSLKASSWAPTSLRTDIYPLSCFLEVCVMEQEGNEPGRDPGLSCLCEEWHSGKEIWVDFGVTQNLGLAWLIGMFLDQR